MSRVEKRLRRTHRREKKSSQFRKRFAAADLPIAHLPRAVRSLSYNITCEPLHLPGECVPGLAEALSDIGKRLFDDCLNNPLAAIPQLQQLLVQFPDAPMLLNWLAAAFTRAGDEDAAQRIVHQNFLANPDYLFARIDYARPFLEKGDLKAVEEIFDNNFDLMLLYPQRDTFHLAEFRAFSFVVIRYLIAKGEFEPASALFDVLEEIDPDSESTSALRSVIGGLSVLELVQKMSKRGRKGGDLPG